MAVNPITDLIHGLDGSIVVCDSPDAMQNWLVTHGLDGDIEFTFYEDVMASMCEDGASYHMDAPTTERFLAACTQDQRFHPEVLHLSDDGWTMFTSAFNPYKDTPEEMRATINGFVLGYLERDAGRPRVVGVARALDAFPITDGDYARFGFSPERLDKPAEGRLASLSSWIAMLNGYDL